ncbi:MAG: arginine--tRNA ligase [Bacteroidales bacterium]|nr:arginine--tRNA ligase [Bacteroidales bacterium]
MISEIIAGNTVDAVEHLFGQKIDKHLLQIEKTNRDYEGDFTLIVFPLLRIAKKSPEETARLIGDYLTAHCDEIKGYNVIKGFLNLAVSDNYWIEFFKNNIADEKYGIAKTKKPGTVVLEYSSPNTNKPLHLGHVRNNLLGFSLGEILKANGKKVIRVNLINDRGIHICKSMLAWMKWGEGETPEKSQLKGDQLVGKYYVLFDKKHKEQIADLVHRGFTDDDAYANAPVMKEAKELLSKWENADEETLEIWHTMNNWAYQGFETTYKRLGVAFDEVNYESKVYLDGKRLVLEGLDQGIFYRKEDSSVWADLKSEGLDEKLLLRSDGTSVYITQDIGTAERRYEAYSPEKMIYVVGNEQIYHFDVLKNILKKLGRKWADNIVHLSYGMVELPHGRMKSREGTVVDADDLMDEMYNTAKMTTEELGKTEGFSKEESVQLYEMLGQGALKYYMLKVDPKKNMLFNPEESIDFNGNTGPFIQYTHARIQSILRKSEQSPQNLVAEIDYDSINILPVEKELLIHLAGFPEVLQNAGDQYSPATLANYIYELAKLFNHYYQDTPILKRIDEKTATFRVLLSWFTGNVIRNGMALLGIKVPQKM